jgi:RNA polymerase sigma-70 factor (ECF subfamily)
VKTTAADIEFAALVRPHVSGLYRLAFRFTGNVADAEDLVQDVLIKVHERSAELTSMPALKPWLGRVLYNQFVDHTRRYARRRLSTVPLVTAAGVHQDAAGVASELGRPEQDLEQEFDKRRLSAALAELGLEHRAVLLMHDAEGYKLEEIQLITGVPIGTLKSRLHRARARLREILLV